MKNIKLARALNLAILDQNRQNHQI